MDAVRHTFKTYACTACGYDFKAPLWCGDRFCEVCSGPRRRRIRARLQSLFTLVVPPFAYSLHHITFTIPNCTDLLATHHHLLQSFRRLRQRAFWRNKVRGGALAVELTGIPGNWHLHLHVVAESRYLPFRLLLKHWRKVSGGQGVYITSPSHANALRYLTKYTTKTCLHPDFTAVASTALKGTRAFTTFGTWHDLNLNLLKIKYACPKCGDISWIPLDLTGYIQHIGHMPTPKYHYRTPNT